MAHLNIEKISLAQRDRDKEEQKKYQRKKLLFILINAYLEENGCIQTANVLKSEVKFALSDYTSCDNINLDLILQDFESYHFLRYQRLPIVAKKIPDSKESILKHEKCKNNRLKSVSKSILSARTSILESEENSSKKVNSDKTKENTILNSYEENRSNGFLNSSSLLEMKCDEWKLLANTMMQEFGMSHNVVHWSDIIGHNRAKQILKEAVIYSSKFKELFIANNSSWKSILFHGPPGTGKTSLAAAVASESKSTFFNVSASSLVSKWRGESEKQVKVLFDLAKLYAPSIIFIDEIDSLLSHRGADHEASRRMKTEFFFQIDSIFSCDKNVVILGASNMPWDLDQSVLRRFEKRLLISMPDFEARILLFKKFLPLILNFSDDLIVKTELNYHDLASRTENYSPSDIELVCKEAKMNFIRNLFGDMDSNHDIKLLNVKPPTKVNFIAQDDIYKVLSYIHPSEIRSKEKYDEWQKSHGAE